MLQELIAYGNTGRESSLKAVLDAAVTNSAIGNIPDDVAAKVISRFVDVFSSTFLNNKRHLVWGALLILCHPDNRCATANFVRKLENSPILSFVIEACENYPQTECNVSLKFLMVWTLCDDRRLSLVLRRSKLLEAVFVVLNSSIAAADYPVVLNVLNVCGNILESKGPIDNFIQLGGFPKLNGAFDSLVSMGLAEYKERGHVSEDLNEAIGRGVYSMSKYKRAALDRIKHLTNSTIKRSLFYFTVEEAEKYILLLNNAYDILPDGHLRTSILLCVMLTYSFLGFFTSSNFDPGIMTQARREVLDDFLLHPGPVSGVGLLVKLIRVLRSADDLNGVPSMTFVERLDDLGIEIPVMNAVIEQEIGEKLVRCALPSCRVSNLSLARPAEEVCALFECMVLWQKAPSSALERAQTLLRTMYCPCCCYI